MKSFILKVEPVGDSGNRVATLTGGSCAQAERPAKPADPRPPADTVPGPAPAPKPSR
jgi:hypothetical protein